MVGAEGFEVSFRSGRFAFSSVGFKGKPVGIQRFSEILRLVLLSLFSYQWTPFRKKLVSLVSPLLSNSRLHEISIAARFA
jgi:hypothetical protein